jgi:hypothetical protein
MVAPCTYAGGDFLFTGTPMSTKPNETLEITVGDEKRELFMSFGLLNQLAKLIGSPDDVAQIYLNGELRDLVLACALAKRKKSGKIIEEVDVDDLEISTDDIEAILEWLGDHVMGFFVRSLTKVAGISGKHKEKLAALVSSLDGSKA